MKLKKIFFPILLSSLTFFLNACTVGPDYQPPRLDIPDGWHEAADSVVFSSVSPVSRWWTVFNDPELDSLITRSVSANKDLRIAQVRIVEARARRGITAADSWPSVDISGAYSRSRRSENASSSTGSSSIGPNDLFQAGFDAGWEMDIFGRVRRAVEAADADIAAAEENRRDVLVTLLAEVARNYVELRGNQRRIAAARENIAAERQTLEMMQDRFSAGLGSRLEVTQVEARLADTESEIPAFETAVKESSHRLAVLAGMAPSALIDELAGEGGVLDQPVQIPVDLPSELLRQRPDIRRAERQLAGATAMIGVATAEFFPRFSLSGLTGLQSNSFSDLVTSGSRYWSIGPKLNWPIFDAGRVRAGIAERSAQQEQALLAYEQRVLAALEEVENALVAYDREQKTRSALEQAVAANQRAMVMADEMYRTGLVDFLNVLESRRLLILSRDRLIRSEQKVLLHLVVLYKALGGGWQIEEAGCFTGQEQEDLQQERIKADAAR